MFRESFIKNAVSLRLLIAVVLAFSLGWLWSSSTQESTINKRDSGNDSERLMSAIQPTTGADALNLTAAALEGDLPVPRLTPEQDQDLKARFNDALQDVQSEKFELAIERFNGLIGDYPGIPELYANLGAAYARSGELERARQTLKNGLEQSHRSKTLFNSLQEIHGALAAAAYQKALDATPPTKKPNAVSLPLIVSLSTAIDEEQLIASLRAQLDDKQQSDPSAELERIRILETQLSASEKNLEVIKSEQALELKELREQLAEQSETLIASQAAEREAQARVVRAEESASDQVEQATAKIEAEQSALLQEKDAVIAKQSQSLARLREQSELQPPQDVKQASDAEVKRQTDGRPEDQAAIELVKGWARVWSAQDVDGYISYYADNYTSGSSADRSEWLEQRQERLTNKEFIEVEVSEFSVQDMGETFSVTFKQHYRSNTVDDTTRKRLVFNKVTDDWSQAKIVDESVVNG